MAYRDDIIALGPDHLWRFDNDYVDSVGTLNGTNTGFASATAITEDATSAVQSNGTGDRVALATAATVDQALAQKAIGGWVYITAIQLPPKSIYREGATGNQLCFVCWAGNNLMLDIVNGSGNDLQLFSQNVLQPNRAYHIFATFSGNGFDDLVSLYVDGVLQDSGAAGGATLASRAVGEWSDPSGSTEVGNATVLLNGLVNCRYQYWASWDSAVSATDVREELFEKGALPGATIASNTQVNMQAALDALADTARPDEPLNIRVEAVTGDGDITLEADNITHDPLASIHVQYMGTGTLTWVNNNGSNASIVSTPNGGTVNVVTPATLTVAPLQTGSEVRVYDAGTTTELAGIESSAASFAASLQANSVDVVVHALGFEHIRVRNVDLTGGDITVPVAQVVDRQYENA